MILWVLQSLQHEINLEGAGWDQAGAFFTRCQCEPPLRAKIADAPPALIAVQGQNGNSVSTHPKNNVVPLPAKIFAALAPGPHRPNSEVVKMTIGEPSQPIQTADHEGSRRQAVRGRMSRPALAARVPLFLRISPRRKERQASLLEALAKTRSPKSERDPQAEELQKSRREKSGPHQVALRAETVIDVRTKARCWVALSTMHPEETHCWTPSWARLRKSNPVRLCQPRRSLHQFLSVASGLGPLLGPLDWHANMLYCWTLSDLTGCFGLAGLSSVAIYCQWGATAWAGDV